MSEAEIGDVVQIPRGEWEALKAEVAELQRAVHRSPGPVPQDSDGRTDRRGLLKHGAVLAAGAVAGGAALAVGAAEPASASTGTMVYGTAMNAGTDQTNLLSSNSGGTLECTKRGPARR